MARGFESYGNWFARIMNAPDFMSWELCVMAEDAIESGIPFDWDETERKLNIIARIGAAQDEYGIPDFQRWFFENHTDKWNVIGDILDEMRKLYISEKLQTIDWKAIRKAINVPR